MVFHSANAPVVSENPSREALSIDELNVWYGDRAILHDVSLTVFEGRIVTVVGPSGSGKTTLLRAVAGLLTLSHDCRVRGKIRVAGVDMTSTPPEQRPVSLLFQGYALFPHMTVESNILFGPRMHAVPRDEARRRCTKLLELVGLSDAYKLRPAQLSGGMQQRVALARALATEPDILLLDEPLSALDRLLQLELERELSRWLRSTGTTALFVTHDQQQAMSLGDQIVVLGRDGNILQTGPPKCVYDSPITTTVANFLGAANLLTVRVMHDGPRPIIKLGKTSIPCRFVSSPLATGSIATALIRPEWFSLAPGASDGTVPAELVSSMYRGDHIVAIVRVPGLDTNVTAKLPTVTLDSRSINLSLTNEPLLYPHVP